MRLLRFIRIEQPLRIQSRSMNFCMERVTGYFLGRITVNAHGNSGSTR